MKVMLSLRVTDGSRGGWAWAGDLYMKEIDTPFLPSTDDGVEIAGDGWSERPRRRWWGQDGSVTVEFPMIVVNPLEDPRMRVSQDMIASNYAIPWYDPEDPRDLLLASGWQPYRPDGD